MNSATQTFIIPFLFSFLLTVTVERCIIPSLRKKAHQPIYESGPSWHASKSGTPTMGGLAFLISVSTILIASAAFLNSIGNKKDSLSLTICVLFAALNSLIGVIDDCKKLIKKENEGLTPRQKIILQAVIAICFLLTRALILGEGTSLSLGSFTIEIGFLYYPLFLFIILGIVNSANLTDGVDGLASSVAFAIGAVTVLAALLCSSSAGYISSALLGAMTGFLIFNLHPAKIFMGDTGSLYLGALTVSIAFTLGSPIIILILGSVYVIEGTSVVLQVIYYKITHKRLFKMAPLHHHLEKCGWSESKICVVAIIVTILSSIPVILLLGT